MTFRGGARSLHRVRQNNVLPDKAFLCEPETLFLHETLKLLLLWHVPILSECQTPFVHFVNPPTRNSATIKPEYHKAVMVLKG